MKFPVDKLVAWIRNTDRSQLIYSIGSRFVFAYALTEAFQGYALGFDGPILGPHDFRQTQTALSAFFIAKGGPWLAYETPLFGAPYAVPFELPIFQLIVAALHEFGGVMLDQAGRYVSIAFFLLTLLPFYRILRRCELSLNASLLTLAMFVCAPLYVFWTRTFMIESTALFFAVLSLSIGLDALNEFSGWPAPGTIGFDKSKRRWVWLFLSAALAVLVKVTTGSVYLLILGLLLLKRFFADAERRQHWKWYLVFVVSAFAAPAVLLVAWTNYVDALKAQNPLTANFLTSHALREWVYGTWEQKTSLQTWMLFWDRTNYSAFGSAVSLAGGLGLAIFGTRKTFTLVACIVAVVAAFATFTNLHALHDYYQYATGAAVLIVTGLGLAAAEGWTPRAKVLLPLLCTAVVFKSVHNYESGYARTQVTVDLDRQKVGEFVRSQTPDSALIFIYGEDYSSVLPYYSRRRALMDRWNHDPKHPNVQGPLARSAALGHELHAVLFCRGDRRTADGRAQYLLKHAPKCTHFKSCEVCM